MSKPSLPAARSVAVAGGASDGGIPNGGLVADTHGAYYGATETDGIYGLGTAFKIVP